MERFIIQQSQTQSDGWVCTDKENLIVCQFTEHQFNETQKFTILEESKFKGMSASDLAAQLARCTREMADWLVKNHYNKAMPEI